MNTIKTFTFLKNTSSAKLIGVTDNTQIMGLILDDSNYYIIVEKRDGNIDLHDVVKESYKQIKANSIKSEEAISPNLYDKNYVLFIYGKNHSFIQQVLLDNPEINFIEGTISCELDHYITDNSTSIEYTSKGICPKVRIVLEDGETFFMTPTLKLKDDSNLLLLDDKIQINKERITINPYSAEIMSSAFEDIDAAVVINEKEVTFKYSVQIVIDNKDLIEKRNQQMDEDINVLADVIFEFDEMLHMQESLVERMSKKNVMCMAKMWVRWIQAGKKQLEDCPAHHIELVKQLLNQI